LSDAQCRDQIYAKDTAVFHDEVTANSLSQLASQQDYIEARPNVLRLDGSRPLLV
jgi:hypothetical protein